MLLILSGISYAFNMASSRKMGDFLQLDDILFFCIFVGGFFGWIGSYFYVLLSLFFGIRIDFENLDFGTVDYGDSRNAKIFNREGNTEFIPDPSHVYYPGRD